MKNFKSVLSLILALAMVLSCFAAFAAGDESESYTDRERVTRFSDVDETSTVGKAVQELALRGVINGRPDGTFGPDENITRAEFSAIVVRLDNLADGLGDDAVTGFSDLDADDTFKWARPYIKVAKDRGMMNGYADGTFGAGDTVTYEQVVAVLMRLRGWGPACEAESKAMNGSWSAGYIKLANEKDLTKNAMSGVSNPTLPATRGTVAILANNSRSLNVLKSSVNKDGEPFWFEEEPKEKGKIDKTTNNDGIVSGTVTATFLAYIVEPDEDLNSNEIAVNNEIYTVDRKVIDSVDLYDLLGKPVKMVYDEKEDIITDIDVTDYSATKIYSGYVGDGGFFLEVSGGSIEYATNPDTYKTYTASFKGEVIFNGKNVDDFRIYDLEDPDSPYYFTNGVIEVVAGRYPFVKISNYETYVVRNVTTRNNIDTINFKYRTGTDAKMLFPASNDADYFVFRRKKTEIRSKSDLKENDVLSVLRSPEDARGADVLIIEATRDSSTGLKVSSVNEDDDRLFMANGRYYQYNYDYLNVPSDSTDEAPMLSRGATGVNLYFDYIGQVAAVTTSVSSDDTGSFAYGFLLDLAQNDKDSDYNLDLYVMDTNGNKRVYGTSNTIQIDGKRYNTTDRDILRALEDSAEEAAYSYMNTSAGDDLQHLKYQQPVRFKVNSKNLLTALDTIAESNIDGNDLVLSARIDDSAADDGLRTYNRSSGWPYVDEKGDDKYFQMSSTATKVLFIPDDRSDYDSYEKKSSSTFTSGNKYYIEAYNIGTTTSGRADLILVYKQDDSMVYNYKSPFMIVTDTDVDDDDNEVILGYRVNYNGTGTGAVDTSVKTIPVNYGKLSREDKEIYNNLGKGDIVRYLLDSDNQVCDLELWLDISDSIQDEPVNSVSEALENRVMAILSNANDPISGDRYNAAFRLAYGTVLRHDKEGKSVTVTPTLVDDNVEMVEGGTGVVAHLYNSNTRVFVYNGSRNGVEYLSGTEAFEELLSYEEAEEGASVVVTYSTGDTTNNASSFKLIYIIR